MVVPVTLTRRGWSTDLEISQKEQRRKDAGWRSTQPAANACLGGGAGGEVKEGIRALRRGHLAKETGLAAAMGHTWLKLHHLPRHAGQRRRGSPQTQSAPVPRGWEEPGS